MDLKFRFVPALPTKTAWANRPFGVYYGTKDLLAALLAKEKSMGSFKYLNGSFRFKSNIYSTYKDGTEAPTYNNPRWWKTGALSCSKGCCTTPPAGETFDKSEAPQIIPANYQRNWQEFRRIAGQGGAADQLSQINDVGTLDKIFLADIGCFYVETVKA